MILHAGLIAARCRGSWRGVLIHGPAGAGKSDLALRAMGDGFQLVSDDYTRLFVSENALFGRAPAPLFGLMEIRGLGIVRQTALAFAQIVLIVRCARDPGAVDRLPDARSERLLGVAVPTVDLWPFEDSAPAKLRRAIEHLGARS
jgi:serine kinase of HPr protein (carbohydrate metabolism regulator)